MLPRPVLSHNFNLSDAIEPLNVILASQNAHKHQEFAGLLHGWKLQNALPFDCEENALTYWGNALLKARTVWERQPANWVLADDSGLEVSALGRRPGIHSARYGGPGLSSAERNALLLEELALEQDRRAHFVCCLVLLSPEGAHYTAQAIVAGRISSEPRSSRENAFGYDPIFELAITSELGPPHTHSVAGQTFAELESKQQLSHRFRACEKLRSVLQTLPVSEPAFSGILPRSWTTKAYT